VRWQGLGLEDAVTRDHLGGGGFTLQRGHVSTGRPTGRRRRERTLTGLPASEFATALVIDELERETALPIETLRELVRRGRPDPRRAVLARAIAASTASNGAIEAALHCRRETVWRLRKAGGAIATETPTKGGSPRALPPPSESSLAERREAA
jgi:hypothetical protein